MGVIKEMLLEAATLERHSQCVPVGETTVTYGTKLVRTGDEESSGTIGSE